MVVSLRQKRGMLPEFGIGAVDQSDRYRTVSLLFGRTVGVLDV